MAAPLFRISVHNMWRHGAGSSNATSSKCLGLTSKDGHRHQALADVGRLHHQLATAFAASFCASEAKSWGLCQFFESFVTSIAFESFEVLCEAYFGPSDGAQFGCQALTSVFAYCLIAYFKNWAADKAVDLDMACGINKVTLC